MRTRPLADEFFLAGHDEYTGKAHVSGAVLDTGLAGAVLGELILDKRLTIVDGRVVVRSAVTIGERVTDAALAEIVKQPDPHPVRAWVEYLRDEARDMVGRRLVEAGVVRREKVRGLVRSSVRFPANDTMAAAAPRVRLRYMLDHPEVLDEPTAVLAALVGGTGLESVLAMESVRQVRDAIAYVSGYLSAEHAALARGVDAAVAAIALTVRR